MADFKDRLKELRKEVGLSQLELSEKVTTLKTNGKTYAHSTSSSQVTMGNWERGTRKPNIDTLKELCNILHVNADYLLGLSDERQLKQKELSDYSTDELMREVLRRWQ